MNVFPNILYPYLRAPTRCSVSETDRPQLYLDGRDAPAGIERQLKRTGETGILRRGGSLNINTYAVPE
jgi:preprotein translocase subunit SecB